MFRMVSVGGSDSIGSSVLMMDLILEWAHIRRNG